MWGRISATFWCIDTKLCTKTRDSIFRKPDHQQIWHWWLLDMKIIRFFAFSKPIVHYSLLNSPNRKWVHILASLCSNDMKIAVCPYSYALDKTAMATMPCWSAWPPHCCLQLYIFWWWSLYQASQNLSVGFLKLFICHHQSKWGPISAMLWCTDTKLGVWTWDHFLGGTVV